MSVRHSLLALLHQEPSYGLRLKEDFESWTGEVWPLNVGQVYTTLQRLERDGLVVADGAEDAHQRYYELSEAGREELRSWLLRPGDVSVPPRDELVMKVLMALVVRGVDPASVIDAHRRSLMEQMQVFTRTKASLGDEDAAGVMVLDAQIFRIEASVRWLDQCEARLAAGARIAPHRHGDGRPTSEQATGPSEVAER